MTYKMPTDMQDMMKMFEPDQITKMLDADKIMGAFDPKLMQGFNYDALVGSNKGNYEAMVAANKAAAAGYKDFYEKQMTIFEDVMNGARLHVDSLTSQPGVDISQKQADVYREAVNQAFAIMTELAATAQRANEEAFAIIQNRVNEAISELQKI